VLGQVGLQVGRRDLNALFLGEQRIDPDALVGTWHRDSPGHPPVYTAVAEARQAGPRSLGQEEVAREMAGMRHLVAGGHVRGQTQAGGGGRPVPAVRMGAATLKRARSPELHLACERGDITKVEELLNAGANVHELDRGRRTALHQAARHALFEITEMLLVAHLSPLQPDAQGMTPLHYAAREGDVNMCQCLGARLGDETEGDGINARDQWGQTALALAAKRGAEDVVQLLMQLGADCDTADCRGRTPLWHAANDGREGMVELLLSAGADPNKRDDEGKSPKDVAVGPSLDALATFMGGSFKRAE
jgi:hypothetical protein